MCPAFPWESQGFIPNLLTALPYSPRIPPCCPSVSKRPRSECGAQRASRCSCHIPYPLCHRHLPCPLAAKEVPGLSSRTQLQPHACETVPGTRVRTLVPLCVAAASASRDRYSCPAPLRSRRRSAALVSRSSSPGLTARQCAFRVQRWRLFLSPLKLEWPGHLP